MKFKIHQIKDIANTDYAFRGYNPNLFNFTQDYECRYEGDLEVEDKTNAEVCEEVFYLFNMRRPEGFTGHSLSISDVVELEINDHPLYYYCNTFGFQRLPQPAQ